MSKRETIGHLHKKIVAHTHIFRFYLIIFALQNDEEEENELRVGGMPIGNDCLFFFAYIVAFVFNWIGLFIGYFIMYSWAGRYGSIAGFGTSLIKWLIFLKVIEGFIFSHVCASTAIHKHVSVFQYSTCCEDYTVNQHDYLWWISCFIGKK